jgi:hypothetical protein
MKHLGMPGDDWVERIHKEREAKRMKREGEVADAERRKAVYEAHVEDFWKDIAREFDATVARYNEGAPADLKVECEAYPVLGKPSWRIAAQWGGRSSVELSLDKGLQAVVLMRRALGGREPVVSSSDKLTVNVSAHDTLRAEGKSPAEVARWALEGFFRSFAT